MARTLAPDTVVLRNIRGDEVIGVVAYVPRAKLPYSVIYVDADTGENITGTILYHKTEADAIAAARKTLRV